MTANNLALDEEELVLRDTVRAFLRDHAPVGTVRRLRDKPTGFDPKLWATMTELGWTTLPYSLEVGGMAAGATALGIVASELGRTLTMTPLLSQVMAITTLERLPTEHAQQLAAAAIAGDSMPVLVDNRCPLPGHTSPPSLTFERSCRGRLSGRQSLVLDGDVATHLLVVADNPDQVPCLMVVDPGAHGIDRRLGCLADGRRVASIEFDVDVAPDDVLATGDEALAASELGAIKTTAVAAAEMVGAASAALDLTVAHLKTREQFGVTLASFQALQHRAARMLGALELAYAASRACLRALDVGTDDGDLLVSVAMVEAKEALSLIAAEGVQMHGGLGMTDEADIGLYLKRARVARSLLGDLNYHCDRIATYNGV